MIQEIKAPMSGKILKIFTNVGDAVYEDDFLVMIEAMKMENPITAPVDGTVKKINVKENDKVEADEVIMVIE
jgi:acetyl-CoA carboxylase biotin carboxyl carrier protein